MQTFQFESKNKVHVVLTNDDGIDAEGIQGFAGALREFCKVTIVAPALGCSCCGHSVTTTSAILYETAAVDQYRVHAFPADCVRVAIKALGLKPDWVVSGVNHGGNLGVDITMSGTVAAAREAALLGFRSMAFSQYRRQDVPADWLVSGQRAALLFKQLSGREIEVGSFWNINLPAIASGDRMREVVECEPDRQAIPFEYEICDGIATYRSNYHQRHRTPGKDVDICFGGNPSASLIRV